MRGDEMIKLNRNKYDYIISLGGCCDVANQLKHRGLRPCAFPLDWTLMINDRPIRYLPEGIRSRFKQFCLRENMREFDPPSHEYGVERRRLEDSVSGFRFIHHFNSTPDDVLAFGKTRGILQKRLDRLYDVVSKSQNVLFVLSTVFTYDAELLKDLYSALAETFPDTDIELVSMQFSSKECRSFVMLDGKIHVETYERCRCDRYDTKFTTAEWKWMDGLSLRGRQTSAEVLKNNRIIRLKYKLWKWLGKSLERSGTACVSMRF